MNNTCGLILNETRIKTYSYQEYYELMETFARIEFTSGSEITPEKVQTTKLNFARMRRWKKSIVIDPTVKSFVQNLKHPQCWTVITEAWCGDSAQNIPGIATLAEASEGKIRLQFVFRDENPEFMNNYLTNGGKAIPKLIARNLNAEDIFTWGPRPATASNIMTQWKLNPVGKTKDEIMNVIHLWYTSNQQKEVISELLELIKKVES